MNCEHVCSSDCRREGCNCLCGEYHETTKEQWVEKEVDAKSQVMKLDAHNKTVLRSMLGKEYDDNERSNRDYVYGWDEGVIV